MKKTAILETSARHVHLDKDALTVLFGEGYELTPVKELSQPGQYACSERVEIIGSKKSLPGVSVLGPLRASSQAELSATDARSIGINAPIRESGDIAGSGGCRIAGPKGEITIKEGVIVAKRHIHMTPSDADRYGLEDRQTVSIKIDSPERSTIFGDVVVRVHENFSLAVHIDTDESNAAGVSPGMECEIIP